MPALVGRLGVAHPGEHPEGPVFSAITRGLVASQIRELARITDVPFEIHLLDFLWTVETPDFQIGHGGPARFLIGILGDDPADLVLPLLPHRTGFFQHLRCKVHKNTSFFTLQRVSGG